MISSSRGGHLLSPSAGLNFSYKKEDEIEVIKGVTVSLFKVRGAAVSGRPTAVRLHSTGPLAAFFVGRSRSFPTTAVSKVSALIIKSGLAGRNSRVSMAQSVTAPSGHLVAPLGTAISL